jgi:2-C-methyl-D-erythritol 4-phosphate cytidylyltransferase
MKNAIKTLAIIPSAGLGRRMAGPARKNYIELLGRPILAHTLAAFEESDLVDAVVVVVTPGDERLCQSSIIEAYGLKKVIKVLPGGELRQGSVRNGLALPDDFGPPELVVVHDGARPLVTAGIIDSTIEKARSTGAAIAAVKVKDTIKEVQDGLVASTLARDSLWAAQTPQAFRAGLLLKAFRKAEADAFTGTDESTLVERLGVRVSIVEGSYENIKITTEDDLLLAERILRNRTTKV